MSRTRLPDETRRALAELYVKSGTKGVAQMAEAHGVTTSSVAAMATRMGMRRDRLRGRTSKDDPRWGWAIARGKIEV